jgi:hypothetical protein
MEKISFMYKKSCSSIQNRQYVFVRDMLRIGILEFASIFFPRNGIPSIFLLCRTVLNRIPRFFFPRNCAERNSESLLIFLFHGTEFRALFSSAERRFGTEFRKFSVPQNSWNSGNETNCSVYSIFRGIFFCRKLPTLISNWQ